MRAHLTALYNGARVTDSYVSPHGYTVACVDMDTQPAFNNPRMRGHAIQRSPSPELLAKIRESAHDSAPLSTLFETYDRCPSNSIPIKVTTLDDMKRFHSLEEFLGKKGPPPASPGQPPSLEPPSNSANGHEYAVINTYGLFTGSQSTLNIWNPEVEDGSEFSLSQIWLAGYSSFDFSDLETIEAGWQVYPDRLHGSPLPHFFIFYTGDNYASGCYDLECAGFVQTDNTVVIGSPVPSSTSGGTQQEGTLAYWRDPDNGNWWLFVNGSPIGYYPTERFDSSGIKNAAGWVSYGGEIATTNGPTGTHTTTDMGSGAFPSAGYGFAAYQRNIQILDNYGIRAPGYAVGKITNPNCYTLVTGTDTIGGWGRYLYFGGPGYDSANCP